MKNKSKHYLYTTWQMMKQRCNNMDAPDYGRYGGMGISVCAAWETNFEQFWLDMGARPEGYTIDRIDTYGNYTPKNCKWSSDYEQNANRRNSSKCVGVNWHKRDGCWQSRGTLNGNREQIGAFHDYFEACCARKSWEAKYNIYKTRGE